LLSVVYDYVVYVYDMMIITVKCISMRIYKFCLFL